MRLLLFDKQFIYSIKPIILELKIVVRINFYLLNHIFVKIENLV